MNQEIYIVGGRGDRNNHGDGDDLATGLRYDALTGDWYDIAPMMRARIYMGVAGDDSADLLYGVGGHGADGTYLEDAECLDTRTGAWRTLPPLNHPRSGSAAIVVDHVLWAIGGYDANDDYWDHVEWFDIQTDEIACRADPECVESLQDWYTENCDETGHNCQHSGAEWTDVQHVGTKDNVVDPSEVGGRRRSQVTPGECASSGLVDVSGACNPPDNSQPTECDFDCARVFLPYWDACGDMITQTLPQISRLLTPMVSMCANPTGFDENAEETGPQLVDRPVAECPPHPTCPVDGPNACAEEWNAYHVCVMDRRNGDTPADPPPHICGDDCDGEWHVLDERMSTRRAVRLCNPFVCAH